MHFNTFIEIWKVTYLDVGKLIRAIEYQGTVALSNGQMDTNSLNVYLITMLTEIIK